MYAYYYWYKAQVFAWGRTEYDLTITCITNLASYVSAKSRDKFIVKSLLSTYLWLVQLISLLFM